MRIIYYYFPDDKLQSKVDKIIESVGQCEVLKIFDNSFANIRARLGVPDHDGPQLISVHNGTLETIWNLTNE